MLSLLHSSMIFFVASALSKLQVPQGVKVANFVIFGMGGQFSVGGHFSVRKGDSFR